MNMSLLHGMPKRMSAGAHECGGHAGAGARRQPPPHRQAARLGVLEVPLEQLVRVQLRRTVRDDPQHLPPTARNEHVNIGWL